MHAQRSSWPILLYAVAVALPHRCTLLCCAHLDSADPSLVLYQVLHRNMDAVPPVVPEVHYRWQGHTSHDGTCICVQHPADLSRCRAVHTHHIWRSVNITAHGIFLVGYAINGSGIIHAELLEEGENLQSTPNLHTLALWGR